VSMPDARTARTRSFDIGELQRSVDAATIPVTGKRIGKQNLRRGLEPKKTAIVL
jgi:hypothetical protein